VIKAAFVDRDGVINEERHHVHRVEDFRLLPGATTGLRRLQEHGWALVVVTNQAGIARGLYGEDDFARLTTHMRRVLAEAGVSLAGVYHCPHHPSAGPAPVECACRKPKPGLLLRAAEELGITLSQSILVGDKISDLQAGRAAGLRSCVLVESGHPTDDAARALADRVEADLDRAAAWIVTTLAPQVHDLRHAPPPDGRSPGGSRA
jgi:D-glycero-D-manno-heptose 1,7-bisphosphate phosphatase